MSTNDTTPMYYSVAPCGCVKMMIVDTPNRAQAVAKEIADAVKAGETVHHSTVGMVRSGAIKLGWCDVCKHTDTSTSASRIPYVPLTPEGREREYDRERLQAWNEGKAIPGKW